MYFYMDLCCGEIMDYLETNNRDLVENKIKNGDYLFSDFMVIKGEDVTDEFLK